MAERELNERARVRYKIGFYRALYADSSSFHRRPVLPVAPDKEIQLIYITRATLTSGCSEKP